MENDGGVLLGGGRAKLRTIDCVAQSLAVGPIFSAAAIGFLLAALSGGVGPFVVIVTTIGILGLGIVVSAFAKRFSGAGAVYEYLAHSLGKRVAIFSAAGYFLAYSFLAGTLPIIFAATALTFCQEHLSISPPWWLLALLLWVIVTVVNIIGIQVSVRAQLVVVALSIVPFVILSIVIIAKGGVSGNTIQAFNPSHVAAGGSIFKGLLFAILMFVGFELAAALGEETENPRRSIPVAVIAVILIVAVIYTVTQYVGVIGEGGPAKLPFDFQVLAAHYVGSWLSVLVGIAIMLDILGIAIGFSAACARGAFALARDGLLPSGLRSVSKRAVPWVGTLTASGVSLLLIVGTMIVYGSGNGVSQALGAIRAEWTFQIFSDFGSLLITLVYAILCIGAIRLFGPERQWVTVIGAVVGLAIAGGGVASQFINGLAPTGDAVWGRTFALIAIALLIAWLVYHSVVHPDRVNQAGEHALQHQMAEVDLAAAAPTGS
jgi:amino acid transporter